MADKAAYGKATADKAAYAKATADEGGTFGGADEDTQTNELRPNRP